MHNNYTLGTQDYICATTARDLAVAEQYTEEPDPPASLEFLEMVKALMTQNALTFPTSVNEAIDLYVTLTTTIEMYM